MKAEFGQKAPCQGRWMRLGLLLTGVCAAVQFLCMPAFSADTKSDDARLRAIDRAAQDAAKLFLPRAARRKKTYGFEPGDNVNAATLGAPVELFCFDDSKVQAYKEGHPIESVLNPTGQCFVPVTIGGTNRAMITVMELANGNWDGSAFGMAPLARAWQNIQNWWPASNRFTPKLIISPTAQGYFFTIPQVKPANLTPLADIPDERVVSAQTPKPALKPAGEGLRAVRGQAAPRGGP